MTENRSNPTAPQHSTCTDGHLPVCPACGGTWLYNVQVIEEERHYRVLTRGSQPTYDDPDVLRTDYVENHLRCFECDWTVPMSSHEARAVLDG